MGWWQSRRCILIGLVFGQIDGYTTACNPRSHNYRMSKLVGACASKGAWELRTLVPLGTKNKDKEERYKMCKLIFLPIRSG